MRARRVDQRARLAFERGGVERLRVAQHRHDQPVGGIDRDANVDLGQHAAALRPFEPCVQRRLRAARGDQRTQQPHQHRRAARPCVDVGVVEHGDRGHLRVRGRHPLRHGAAHAAQLLAFAAHAAQRLARRGRCGLRRAPHVGAGDRAVRPRARHRCQIDAQFPRQRAHRRRGAYGRRRRGGRWCRRAPRFELADDRSSIGRVARKADQRRTHPHHLALRREQLLDAAGEGRRNVHHRLVGLHRHHRRVGGNVVAGLDVPLDDLGFLQAFAEVGKIEDFHYP